MNCVACHTAEAPVAARLASKRAPVLGENGLRITPQWLRSFLMNPQGVTPGTTMPDALHWMGAKEKAETVDALVHYLISLQSPHDAATFADATVVAKGRDLYHTVGCVACHAPDDPPPHGTNDTVSKSEIDQLSRDSVPLGMLDQKTTVPEMAAFLRNPLQIRPSGRMPSLKLGDAEATAIGMYLLRGQMPEGGATKGRGLAYELFEGNFSEIPDFDRLKVNASGVTEKIKALPRQGDTSFAMRFTGTLKAPIEGEYVFSVKAGGATRLSIDEKLLIDNGMHHGKEKGERIVLTAGDHLISLLYANGGGGDDLAVSWRGPKLKEQELGSAALSHPTTPLYPTAGEAFSLDHSKAERGRRLFASLNCAACHQIGERALAAKPLASLALGRPDSCIGKAVAKGLPKYALSDEARAAVQTTLGALGELAKPLAPAEQINRTMSALNCFACHNRAQRGGAEGPRRDYFTSAGGADVGDEGRLPPSLNGVGAKLKPEAIASILWQGAVARPYMQTRMPQFGEENVKHLVPAFDSADSTSNPLPEPPAFASSVSTGRKLVGVNGLACVACHTFKQQQLGIPAVDLTLMHNRLKFDWFHRYVIDPQSLRPGTRMLSFWPGGHAVNKQIAGGDTDRQIEAIWYYLAKGAEADPPDGLIKAKMELVPDKEAIIYRNFILGAGARAIGVGYPERANLAFDAEEMRLALLWQGPFIDASRHRTQRGLGFEPPLGTNVVKWTAGPPLAVLPSQAAQWPAAVGKAGGFQFRGYHLDEEQRPTFLYDYMGTRVEDYPLAVAHDPDAGFRRTLSFTSARPPAQLYFRAAAGAAVVQKANGSFLVDDKVLVTLTGGKASIRRTGKLSEIIVPLIFQDGKAQITEELNW